MTRDKFNEILDKVPLESSRNFSTLNVNNEIKSPEGFGHTCKPKVVRLLFV